MNKQIGEKVDLFMSGLMGRFAENREFFIEITAAFLSGSKRYELRAVREEALLAFYHNGAAYCLTADAFRAFIKEQIPLYDSMLLIYRERGKDIRIRADQKSVTTETTASAAPAQAGQQPAAMGDRAYYIRADRAAPLLRTIGLLGQNGKVKNDKIRKYNQIDHFVELIDPMLRTLCRQHSVLQVVDCACGKSYLSFVLNYYIKEVLGQKCHITGLDYNGGVIAESKRMAAQLNYQNMMFVETDIMQYIPQKSYQLLLTLHACDTATDKALSFGIRHKIPSIVCVPCCHRELNAQYHLDGFSQILKYGVLKARIADNLTDGLRAMALEAFGYDVSMVEYISPLDTPKNLMIRAEHARGFQPEKWEAYLAVCRSLGAELTLEKDLADLAR